MTELIRTDIQIYLFFDGKVQYSNLVLITRHEFPHNHYTFTVYLCLQGWLFISITCTEHQCISRDHRKKGTRWRLRSLRRFLLRRLLFPFQVK
jgi:hypothetical protein